LDKYLFFNFGILSEDEEKDHCFAMQHNSNNIFILVSEVYRTNEESTNYCPVCLLQGSQIYWCNK